MFDLDGRVLAQVERLDQASEFLPRIRAVLGHDSILSRIGEEEAEYLAGFMSYYRAPADTLLIREGDAGGFLVLVIDGAIEIRKARPDGGKAPLARLGPGDTLGEMSLLDGQPRSADCVTLEPSTFAVLNRGVLDLLLRQNPALVNKLLTQIILILSQRLRQASDILSETLRPPVPPTP